jgi:predicted ATPase/DNA-binding XRE family transcriptional regulator
VDSDQLAFGDLLRRHRVTAGLTQEALAERAGLSVRGLSDLERGARRAPYRDTAIRLAEALGLDGTDRAALVARTRRAGPRAVVPPAGLSVASPPVPLSSFIGREREIAQVRRLLRESRLLTLIGTGGIGKTRLAMVASEGDNRTAGTEVAFVDLAPVFDPELLAQTVAAALGVREQTGQSILVTLIAALQPKELLLVLDNCEQLVDACATLADALLHACPNLHIIATSREPLRIAGETVCRVPPLELPSEQASLEQIKQAESVRLFVARACAAEPAFVLSDSNAQSLAEVCRRLDGIPLALELAAAQAPLMSVQQLSGRLGDALGLLTRGSRLAPARQRTVRATIEWSYGLLAETEQRLFDRLAVFAGGWTLEAAEAVAGVDDLDHREVLGLLGRLVDTSLVLVESDGGDGPVRYRLLEALRQYGWERLIARGSATAIQRQHAEFFSALAAQLEPAIISGSANGWTADRAIATLQREHDNMRAALRWLLAQAELVDAAQRLAGVFGRYCFQRGLLAEGHSWLMQALAVPSGDQPTIGRAKCLFALGTIALSHGEYAAVEHNVGEALRLWQHLGEAAEECWSLFVLGFVARRRGDYHAARGYLESGIQQSRAAGQGAAESSCLRALAEVAADLGQDEEARGLAEAALVRATEAGWGLSVIVAHRILGALSVRQGEYAMGRRSLEVSLAEARRLAMPWWTAETLVSLGQATLEQGNLSEAHRFLGEGLTMTCELDDRFGMAGALEGFVRLAVAAGVPRESLVFASAANALRALIGTPLPPAEQPRLEHQLATARRALGEPAAKDAWGEGRAASRQQILQQALSLAVHSQIQG